MRKYIYIYKLKGESLKCQSFPVYSTLYVINIDFQEMKQVNEWLKHVSDLLIHWQSCDLPVTNLHRFS